VAALKRFKPFKDSEKNILAEALFRWMNDGVSLDDDDFYEQEEKDEMRKVATKLAAELNR